MAGELQFCLLMKFAFVNKHSIVLAITEYCENIFHEYVGLVLSFFVLCVLRLLIYASFYWLYPLTIVNIPIYFWCELELLFWPSSSNINFCFFLVLLQRNNIFSSFMTHTFLTPFKIVYILMYFLDIFMPVHYILCSYSYLITLCVHVFLWMCMYLYMYISAEGTDHVWKIHHLFSIFFFFFDKRSLTEPTFYWFWLGFAN